jgi:acyloxyacyl hydrolase
MKILPVSSTNRKADTVPEMTTPEQMYANVMQTLTHLNSHLPNGSHVILYGLPDGTFLWDSLHNRYHPLGILYLQILFLFSYLYECADICMCVCDV